MQWFVDLLNWFAGKSGDGMGYHRLFSCMREDWLWITITVALDVTVAVGYLMIARHWYQNQKALRNERAKRAMGRMKNIFIFCGLCGYVFIPIKMFWPAWRLYDLVMAGLVYFTWRYALDTRGLGVVYNELNRSDELAADLEKTQEESRRKSYFLNAVSHDLRTPLNGLSLQVDLAALSLETGDSEAARKAIADARRSAAVTAELLNSFLDLARLDWAQDENAITTFGVLDAVARAARRFDVDVKEKGLALAVTGDAAVRVRSDRLKLERIVANLVANGVKFTDRGGVHVDVRREGREVLVDVADTGIGISAEERASLFDEFYQVGNAARDRSKGTGLGLAVCRRLAAQVGARLSVSSEPGKGSRFTVALPGVVIVESGHDDPGGTTDDGRRLPSIGAVHDPERGEPAAAVTG